MGALLYVCVLACTFFVSQANGLKTYRDMFPHKHSLSMKFPPIPGWNPDSNPWDDYLYPPFGPKELTRRKGKPVKVRLTSDSPAINGSVVSFTAKLEYPPCQKEDANGELVWDDHCLDGMELEASANSQLKSGYVFNWTSWLDDYGFGKCTDLKRCKVFPDGKPFPQSNDWRHKGYVYVWHSMGQYSETCDGSSSTLTVNTSDITLGAELMEVMVYRKRERRKYSPLATDKVVFFVTDKIPVAVNISQKASANLSESVFVRGEDVVFSVSVHDPSNYLKTADAVDYIWDFKDGNQLVTHSNVATHTYSAVGNVNVKLMVEAAFKIPCPPAMPTSVTSPKTTAAPTPTPGTHAITRKMETTHGFVPVTTARPAPNTPVPMTTGFPTTEPLPTTVADVALALFNPIQLFAQFLLAGPTPMSLPAGPTPMSLPAGPTPMSLPAGPTPMSLPAGPTPMSQLRHRHLAADDCFRYLYGTFQTNITIIEHKHLINSQPANWIVDVSAAKLTNTDISFLVKCLGSTPTSACTIVSDPSCHQVRSIVCDDVPPSSECEVRLRRTFLEPGTYCVNITLEDASSLALTTTITITISNTDPDTPVSKAPHAAEVVLSSSAILVAIFAFTAFMVYKRYKVYKRVRRSLVEDASGRGHVGVGGRMSRLREVIFPTNEERSRLLSDRRPL
ncbi:protein QNR-71-like isoform X1 [Coregonus clupeaformis]|uniref:protein QNR-71-like isoform X1 n=1 Tax=Coregonus clupeaformis TaxID=59861 RepID=UPI001E1C9AE8|nr:protein QNR-71-like isoform X1 [Coregonus clupeaformis]